MIRKKKGRYELRSKSGRVLGRHKSRAKAETQERAIAIKKARKRRHAIPKPAPKKRHKKKSRAHKTKRAHKKTKAHKKHKKTSGAKKPRFDIAAYMAARRAKKTGRRPSSPRVAPAPAPGAVRARPARARKARVSRHVPHIVYIVES